ncbi:unnamed protein product, partial [Rotaria magnacalcarata]
RNIPRRWRNQNINQQSNEINQVLKKLQALNDNRPIQILHITKQE